MWLSSWAAAHNEIVGAIETAKTPEPGGVGLPAPFEPETVGIENGLAFDIEVRLRAFKVMALYNDALLALAEGNSSEKVGASFGALSESILSLSGGIPGLGAAAPLVKTFLSVAEAAHTRAEFFRVIEEGRPIIVQIITFLKDDTRAYDQIRRARANRTIDIASDEAADIFRSMFRLASDHAEPTDGDLASAKLAAAVTTQDVLTGFGFDIDESFRSLPTTGTKEYSMLVQSQLDQFAQSLRERADVRLRAVADVARHQQLLSTYVELLNAMDAAFAKVQARLNSPPDIIAAGADLAIVALRVRSQIAAL